jgi:hypothetical protein
MKLVFLTCFTLYSIHIPARAVGNFYLHYKAHINYGYRKYKLGKYSTRGIPFHFTSVYRMGNGWCLEKTEYMLFSGTVL